MKNSIKYSSESNIYATCRQIDFQIEINGIKASGCWNAISGTVSGGVDTNSVFLKNERFAMPIDIFAEGGSFRTYEICSWEMPESSRQPKSLAFTGPRLETKHLKQVFISKIKKALSDPEKSPKLSRKFLETFKLV